ncbi:MAG: hypothetical protein ABFD62_02110 [Syntrophaceae bacterium]
MDFNGIRPGIFPKIMQRLRIENFSYLFSGSLSSPPEMNGDGPVFIFNNHAIDILQSLQCGERPITIMADSLRIEISPEEALPCNDPFQAAASADVYAGNFDPAFYIGSSTTGQNSHCGAGRF